MPWAIWGRGALLAPTERARLLTETFRIRPKLKRTELDVHRFMFVGLFLAVVSLLVAFLR